MTKFPAAIDSQIELPIVIDNQTTVSGDIVNGHRDAIIAIEQELGRKPSGIYTNVRSRFAALELALANISGGYDPYTEQFGSFSYPDGFLDLTEGMPEGKVIRTASVSGDTSVTINSITPPPEGQTRFLTLVANTIMNFVYYDESVEDERARIITPNFDYFSVPAQTFIELVYVANHWEFLISGQVAAPSSNIYSRHSTTGGGNAGVIDLISDGSIEILQLQNHYAMTIEGFTPPEFPTAGRLIVIAGTEPVTFAADVIGVTNQGFAFDEDVVVSANSITEFVYSGGISGPNDYSDGRWHIEMSTGIGTLGDILYQKDSSIGYTSKLKVDEDGYGDIIHLGTPIHQENEILFYDVTNGSSFGYPKSQSNSFQTSSTTPTTIQSIVVPAAIGDCHVSITWEVTVSAATGGGNIACKAVFRRNGGILAMVGTQSDNGVPDHLTIAVSITANVLDDNTVVLTGNGLSAAVNWVISTHVQIAKEPS